MKNKRTEHVLFGNFIKKFFIPLSVVFLSACGGGGGSGVGDQDDAEPIARALVLGAGATQPDGSFVVRSGAEVLLTGKDSTGVDDPLLGFEWSANWLSGSPALTSDQLLALLVERTANTRLFSVPTVQTESVVEFLLTVTDADGVSHTDSMQLTIQPASDANVFLNQGAVSDSAHNKYELVVALDLEPLEVTASSFEVFIETIAEWFPSAPHADCIFGVDGDRCQTILNTETVTGSWPTGITEPEVTAADPTSAYFNPHYLLEIPVLDIDDINQNFEDTDREKRIELYNVKTVDLTQRFSFVSADNTSQLMILDTDGDNTDLLSLRSDGLSAEIDVDEIRRNRGIESEVSATAYYTLVDPNGEAETLQGWLDTRGFNSDVVSESEFAHAIYLNNYDLGFGRDMFMRTDDCGNVYTYVENYPSLEAAIQKRGNFATVVMEYAPLELPVNGVCGDEPKMVKFFSYVPDNSTGDRVRALSMNFDGRGEKFLPGVCTACHAGSPTNITEFVAGLSQPEVLVDEINNLTLDQKVEAADLNATFMPFDLDSFLYTEATNGALVDSDYDPQNFTEDQLQEFSREGQLDQFLTFNKAVIRTHLDHQAQLTDPDEQARWDAPIALINSWYGTDISNLADVDLLEGTAFDGSAILDGWLGEEDLYHDVFARYCRACHIQLENVERNFDVVTELIDFSDPELIDNLTHVLFVSGKMPQARLTMDRFWVSYDGAESAASILQTALNTSSVPGIPVADFEIDPEEGPYQPGDLINLDASLYSDIIDEFSWSLVNDCGSTAFLVGANSAKAFFEADESPCVYSITLNVENTNGVDDSTQQVITDRTPVAIEIDIDDPIDGYTPGDSEIVIDIDSYIFDRGDNDLATPMNVVINDTSDPDLTENTNVSNDSSDGMVVYRFPALAGTSDSFNYKLRDFNSSLSNAAVVTVAIDPIAAALQSPSNITATTADLGWTVPAGLVATYNVYRNDPPVNDNTFDPIATNIGVLQFSDVGLAVNSDYEYRVGTVLGAEESFSNTVSLSTTSGIPTGLSYGSTTTSVSLSWSISNASPVNYTVYRNGFVIGTTPNSTPAYTDTGRTPNTPYTYTVRANYSGGSQSSSSAGLVATTTTSTPTGLSVGTRTTSSIALSWSSTNGGTPTYRIYEGATLIASTTNTSRTITGLSSDTAHTYFVRADGTLNNSGNSVSVNTSTLTSWEDDVYPILDDARGVGGDCGGCHGSPGNGNFRISGNAATLFDELKGNTDGDSRVNPAFADYILDCVNDGCSPMTDANANDFSTPDTATISKWVSEGALEN